MAETKPNNTDPFFKLKHIAYRMAQNPSKLDGDVGLEEFVIFAKFQLSCIKKILFWDSIWDSYTDEQILIEYYATLMDKDSDFLKRFEVQLTGGAVEDALDWMDEEIRKNAEHLKEKKAKELEGFEETPQSLGK